MTDSGSGRHDQDRESGPFDGSASGDDYSPSASWETTRGSSWQNTTPYESPFARPDSSNSSNSSDSGSSASSYGSAPEAPADSGPWPAYPESQPVFDTPQGGDAPQGYGPPQGYGSPSQPDQGQQPGYSQQPDYSQQQPYHQPQSTYGQQAYGGNPYQQPGYVGYALPNHPQATTALILGIVGLALCPFVGIGAFVMGGRVRREIDAAPGRWGGRGLATGGWVLGIISIVYAALVLVYLVAVLAAVVTSI